MLGLYLISTAWNNNFSDNLIKKKKAFKVLVLHSSLDIVCCVVYNS